MKTIVVWRVPHSGAPGAVNTRFAAYVEGREGSGRWIKPRAVVYADGKHGDQPDPAEADAAIAAIRAELDEPASVVWRGVLSPDQRDTVTWLGQ